MIFRKLKVITIFLVVCHGFIVTHGIPLNTEDLDDDFSGKVTSWSQEKKSKLPRVQRNQLVHM